MPYNVNHNTILEPIYINLQSNEYSALINTRQHSSFELYRPITIPNNVDAHIAIENFKFTNSIYNVNSYNRVFYYGLASGSYAIQSINIPVSNYSITTLITYLNANIGNGFTFTYDDATFKITVTNTEEFILYNSTNCILKVIGFSFENQSSSGNTITSNQMINLLGVQIIKLNVENLSFNSYSIKGINQKKTLLSVPLQSIQGDSQTNFSNVKHLINDKIITHLVINLTDENDNVLELNGSDWYLNINLFFTYKNEHIPETLLNLEPKIETENEPDEK